MKALQFSSFGSPTDVNLLDSFSRPDEADVHQVDVAWTLQQRTVATSANRKKL
jgi:hypothetical protein